MVSGQTRLFSAVYARQISHAVVLEASGPPLLDHSYQIAFLLFGGLQALQRHQFPDLPSVSTLNFPSDRLPIDNTSFIIIERKTINKKGRTLAFFAKGLHARKHKTARTVGALLLREMATTYGRSPGGYLWAILEPIAGIALLSIIFSAAFRTPPLGTSFPLFYASGYLPFVFFTALSSKVGASIKFSQTLLNYPSVTYFDAILARFLLTSLTHVMVFVIVTMGLVTFVDIQPIFDPIRVLNSLGMAMALGLGIGTLNCFLFSMVPIWIQAWNIITRPLFIIPAFLAISAC